MKTIALIFTFFFVMTMNAYSSDNKFEKADANKDGKIDAKEFDAYITNKFKQYDKNKDGFIDKNEFNVPKDVNAEKEFNFIDRSKDGKVTIEEFKAAAVERFKFYDENKDSVLSAPEYRSNRAYPILKFYF